jgi:hypothetical protein
MFDWLFGGSENPADAALDLYSLEDMENMLMEWYGPYREAGMRALPTLEEQMMMLLTSPSTTYNMLSSGYETSPGYEFQQQENMNAANSAAAAGGMAGTPAHQQQAMNMSQGTAAQDYNNYMNHMMSLYTQGLGVGNNINQMGYNASSAIAQDLARFMGAQMGLTYQGAAQQQAMSSSLMGALMGLGGTIGGAMLGGPAGAAAGGAAGKSAAKAF